MTMLLREKRLLNCQIAFIRTSSTRPSWQLRRAIMRMIPRMTITIAVVSYCPQLLLPSVVCSTRALYGWRSAQVSGLVELGRFWCSNNDVNGRVMTAERAVFVCFSCVLVVAISAASSVAVLRLAWRLPKIFIYHQYTAIACLITASLQYIKY